MTTLKNALQVLTDNDHCKEGFSVTYSAEDDKLRIYYPYRSDRVIYDLFVEMGFKSAPKQECLFAKWAPLRSDFCLMVCEGEIEAEGSTMADRAEAKTARLAGYQTNRLKDANRFQQAASRYSERFAQGQPILIGHHSEASARRDQKRADTAMRNAISSISTANYWDYRIAGIERYTDRKNTPAVRARRIKTLLKELRDHQKNVNHYHFVIKLWKTAQEQQDDKKRSELMTAYIHGSYGRIAYYKAYNELVGEEKTPDEIAERCIEIYQDALDSNYQGRWIEHILNRLGYESNMLGKVGRYEGNLTPVILQKFLRVFGVESPKVKKAAEGEGFTATSLVDLPLFIADTNALTLTSTEWVLLMQDLGYSIAENTARKTTTPLLNIDTDTHVRKALYNKGTEVFEVVRMTKAEYSATRSDGRGVCTSLCGQYRFKTVFIQKKGASYGFSGYRAAVCITDSKQHPKPEQKAA